jgi:hypothetical protein
LILVEPKNGSRINLITSSNNPNEVRNKGTPELVDVVPIPIPDCPSIPSFLIV